MIEDASFSIIINPQDKSLNNIINNNNTSEHLTKIPMSYADIQAHDQSKVKSSKHTMQFYKTNNNNNNNNSTNNNNNITSNGLKKHLDKSDSQVKNRSLTLYSYYGLHYVDIVYLILFQYFTDAFFIEYYS